MADERQTYEGWTIIELFGHRRLAGYVSEFQIAGASFIRIQVPGENGEWAAEQSYGPAAVYSITPCTEEAARAVAKRSSSSSEVTQFSLPAPRITWPCPQCQYPIAVPEDDRARCRGCYTEYSVERTSSGMLFHVTEPDHSGSEE